jgi:hypothetical protein
MRMFSGSPWWPGTPLSSTTITSTRRSGGVRASMDSTDSDTQSCGSFCVVMMTLTVGMTDSSKR